MEALFCYLEDNIKEIFNDPKLLTKRKYIDVYSKVYNFCTRKIINTSINDHKKETKLERDRIYYEISGFIENITKKINDNINKSNNKLELYSILYRQFMHSSKIINNIFQYFNKVHVECVDYIKRNIYDLCKYKWYENVILTNYDVLYQNIIEIINTNRELESMINLDNSRITIDSYICLYHEALSIDIDNVPNDKKYNIYIKCFEIEFIKDTRLFYNIFSNNLHESISNDIISFINKVSNIINYELSFCESRLETITADKIKPILIEVLISNNIISIMETFHTYLVKTSFDVIKEIYLFINNYLIINESSNLVNCFNNFCSEYCENNFKEIKETKDSSIVTEKIINVYEHIRKIISTCFDNNKVISMQFDNIYRKQLNLIYKDNTILCNCINKYLDSIIKDSIKNNIDIDTHEKYKPLFNIINYVNDTDYLLNYYKYYLTKRLLNTQYNLDNEDIISHTFQVIFGNDFTSKIVSMLNDMKTSEKLNDEYRYTLTGSTSDKKKFNTKIITSAMWSADKFDKLEYPVDLSNHINNFTDFYNKKYSGRKLVWNNSYIYGDVVCNCFDKKYILTCNLDQINTLLKFNYNESYNEADFNNINTDIFEKGKIIVREDNKLVLNKKFKNKKLKINLRLKPKKQEKNNKMKEKFDFDRSIVMQAVIVRIMKTHSKINHNDLVTETISQVSKFVPKMSEIKKTIEKLIDKDYMERDTEDKQTYIYVA